MNKKLLVVSILAVLMLIAISFATAVTSNTTTTTKKKESPLFGIRTKLAIGQKLQDLTTRFIRQRVFFLPFQWLRSKIYEDSMGSVLSPTCINWLCTYEKTTDCATCDLCTYHKHNC